MKSGMSVFQSAYYVYDGDGNLMRGTVNCFDNAVIESFFSTLKTECVTGIFLTHAPARTAIFEYMEVWYNRQRLHSTLGYSSLVDFEQRFLPFDRVHKNGASPDFFGTGGGGYTAWGINKVGLLSQLPMRLL